MKVELKSGEKGKQKVERAIEVSPVLGSLEEMVSRHGKEVVEKVLHDKINAATASKVLALMGKNKKDEEIHKAVAEMKLGMRKPVDKVAKAMELLKGKSKEEILAILGLK